MKAEHKRLYEAAELCSVIQDLAHDLQREPGELASAMVAIHELASGAHDRIDNALRRLRNDPGIGYLDAIRVELDVRPKGVA